MPGFYLLHLTYIPVLAIGANVQGTWLVGQEGTKWPSKIAQLSYSFYYTYFVLSFSYGGDLHSNPTAPATRATATGPTKHTLSVSHVISIAHRGYLDPGGKYIDISILRKNAERNPINLSSDIN